MANPNHVYCGLEPEQPRGEALALLQVLVRLRVRVMDRDRVRVRVRDRVRVRVKGRVRARVRVRALLQVLGHKGGHLIRVRVRARARARARARVRVGLGLGLGGHLRVLHLEHDALARDQPRQVHL